MFGGAGAPQNMADTEVNCIYADIQNSAVIGSIFGEKKKKKKGKTKQKQGRLTDWCAGRERMEN